MYQMIERYVLWLPVFISSRYSHKMLYAVAHAPLFDAVGNLKARSLSDADVNVCGHVRFDLKLDCFRARPQWT